MEKIPTDIRWPGCDPVILQNLKWPWKDVISRISADLGTPARYDEALRRCGRAFPAKDARSAILMISFGNGKEDHYLVNIAKETGRRVFIIAIGAAPYHDVFYEAAEATGGKYLTLPSPDYIDDAFEEVFHMLREPLMKAPKIYWPKGTVWKSANAPQLYNGSSYFAAAFLKEPVDKLRISFEANGTPHKEVLYWSGEDYGPELVRLGANIRLRDCKDSEKQETLGLKYGLGGPETFLLLNVERQENEKADEWARLCIQRQMEPEWDFTRTILCFPVVPDSEEASNVIEG